MAARLSPPDISVRQNSKSIRRESYSELLPEMGQIQNDPPSSPVLWGSLMSEYGQNNGHLIESSEQAE